MGESRKEREREIERGECRGYYAEKKRLYMLVSFVCLGREKEED